MQKHRLQNLQSKFFHSNDIDFPFENHSNQSRLTKAVCIDCEMVGIGELGADNMVARVSIVNQLGQCLYDKYVLPNEPVVDYRTAVSGVTEQHLQHGLNFQ